jgi:hypothetical protein
MSLKASEQIVLDAIEHNLRTADPELTIAFESFATVTAHAALPASEQLSGPWKPAVRPPDEIPEPKKLSFAMRLAIIFLVGMVLAGTALALFSGGRQGGCPAPTGAGFAQAKAAGGAVHGQNAPSCSGTSRR